MKAFLLFLFFVISINCACQQSSNYCCCNDMEMFEQCDRVQNQIYEFVDLINSLNTSCNVRTYVPLLHCEQSIACCTNCNSEHADNMCQNMDSYDKCQSATYLLAKFVEKASLCVNIPLHYLSPNCMPVFSCISKSTLSGSRVYNYHQPSPSNSSNKNGLTKMYLIYFLLLILVAMNQ
jgi:hypothetical protein